MIPFLGANHPILRVGELPAAEIAACEAILYEN
jgi:hypothetical protein